MIKNLIEKTIRECRPDIPIYLEHVTNEKNGDYALTAAFILAKQTKRKPLDVANEIVQCLSSPIFEKVEVAPPGFINIFLAPDFLRQQLKTLKGDDFITKKSPGDKVLIEFVSVNPTGPPNVVSARAAAIGDTLVRFFNCLGDTAKSEFYVCDTGTQIENLGQSLLARIKEQRGEPLVIPENGYPGEYLIPIAQDFIKEGLFEDVATASSYSIKRIVEQQRKVLERFGVVFDRWFYEHEIYEKRLVEKVMGVMKDKKLLFKQDGALWFKATEFGDIRDRVIETKDGRHTYLLPDIGYHWNKFDRGFDRLLTILGPDHQGHVPSLKAGVKAMNLPLERLEFMIVQQVNLVKGEKHLAMSKRGGVFVTLAELMEKVPVDVVRFFFLMKAPSQPLDFDVELALKETEENPVYYVQYGHARIASILEFAKEKNITDWEKAKLELLKEIEEIRLIKHLLIFPETIERCLKNLEPHHLIYYLLDLANKFHHFYQQHRVVGEDLELSKARLFLVDKVKTVINHGLNLLGVSSPEKM